MKHHIVFDRRLDGTPLEQLVDSLIFLSGGIFEFVQGIAYRAEEFGFAGKVRIDVIAKQLLDEALEPLAEEHDHADLERAVDLLHAATERIGRKFYADQYEHDPEDDCPLCDADEDDDVDWAETA